MPGDASNGGMSISGTTTGVDPRPDGSSDVVVSTTVSGSPASVDLLYTVNYDADVTEPMTSNGDGTYSFTIPKSVAAPGTLLRWAVVAQSASGEEVRDPPTNSTGALRYGTIVADTSDETTLPVFELFCNDTNAPWSTGPETNNEAQTGGKGWVAGCSLWANGSYYDNVRLRRKGSTSLSWPKPKMRVNSNGQGKLFATSPGYRVKSFSLSSNWAEPGENTFMREPLVWETFSQMGVDHLVSYQTHVRFNGAYFGRFIYVEDWTEESLARNGYDVANLGALFKSESGEYSNLRWDLPEDQVLNYMAAQTLILNQDRCTKNYFLYQDSASGQWSMLPWDVESGFGIDRGLGGTPAPDYCILACEQWNSPLYCNRQHVQDLLVKTPWTLILSDYNFNGASSSAAAGRRLLRELQALGGIEGLENVPANGAAALGQALPGNSTISATDLEDQTKLGSPPSGANGTLNWMLDAVLSSPRARSMYVRRLRTLMDEFTNGRLETLVTDMYNEVKAEAERDNAKWGNTGTPEKGHTQLITEQLPIRKTQLYDIYGPKGAIPLIPDAQGSVTLQIGDASADAGGYVQVINPGTEAVDISGRALSGAVQFTFAPGTVIAAGDTLHVSGDLGAFLKAKGGQGLYVVGPYSGSIQGSAASVTIG
ncbi:hypothetical protein QBZ16_002933 [Prototheca wickerhamii]|uniref:Uncharacterized protein n=1 Tax=Prototheca wickerhamii TaxID=3111 RepID=A0AAD9ING9_PROWI|nr:hypothetical protein QBZ16_002933 [Prototheca wickerhamii]